MSTNSATFSSKAALVLFWAAALLATLCCPIRRLSGLTINTTFNIYGDAAYVHPVQFAAATTKLSSRVVNSSLTRLTERRMEQAGPILLVTVDWSHGTSQTLYLTLMGG